MEEKNKNSSRLQQQGMKSHLVVYFINLAGIAANDRWIYEAKGYIRAMQEM